MKKKWKFIKNSKLESNIKKFNKRQTKENFKMWRNLVLERDNNKCVICNINKHIHCHHILPREDKSLRFEIFNGLTLCAKHHKYSREISAHNNPFMFFLWLEKHKPEQFLWLESMCK